MDKEVQIQELEDHQLILPEQEMININLEESSLKIHSHQE